MNPTAVEQQASLQNPPPRAPAINGIVPATHPWAQHWISQALSSCERAQERWRSKR
jgi:hypothetical protein